MDIIYEQEKKRAAAYEAEFQARRALLLEEYRKMKSQPSKTQAVLDEMRGKTDVHFSLVYSTTSSFVFQYF